MKFLHREIHSFEDAQRNFEQLEGLFNVGLLTQFVQTSRAVSQTLGDAALVYAAGTFAINGTVSNVLGSAAMTSTTSLDAGSRLSNGVYTCRNTGIYLAVGQVMMDQVGGGAMGCNAIINGPQVFEADTTIPAASARASATCVALLTVTAGQTVQLDARSTGATTLLNTGLAGKAATFLACMQVM